MSKQTVAIIDYGMGNLHSVASALEYVAPDINVVVTANAKDILHADRVIFPGVGAIGDCMAEINRLEIPAIIQKLNEKNTPLLGICVGMQALMQWSEESGGTDCLGLFDGHVRSFASNECFAQVTDESSRSNERLKVPHMGWNQVTHNSDHPLWQGIANNSRFYFVHSFYLDLNDASARVGQAHYGIDFTAAVAYKNIFAVQFHPEKSHSNGLTLLKNFVNWQV